MGRSPDGSGLGWPLLLGGAAAGVIGAMPAVVAYLQLTQPDQLRDDPSLWYLAAASPVVAAFVTVRAGGWPHRAAGPTVARRAAMLLGATVAAAMIVLVVAGRSLDADGPGRSGLAAYAAAALVSMAGVAVLRRRRPPTARDGRRDGRDRKHNVNAKPRPGQIWWGLVPFDGTEEPVHRPFLVLRLDGQTLTVLPITDKDNTGRRDFAPFCPDPRASALKPGSVRMRKVEIDLRDLDRRYPPERCPDPLWHTVQVRFGPPPQRSSSPPPRSPSGARRSSPTSRR